MMIPENRKHTRVMLIIAGVLALLLAVNQAVLYFYANAHFKEILRNGSVKLLGLLPVTESASYANPNLTAAVVGALLSAVCLIAAHLIQRRNGRL